ncbi:MAG: hypothetical protein KDA84_22250 [Planctomycetaceae bacterium]|nr:hypothetical protein [Planctomycetaceae bacterium]
MRVGDAAEHSTLYPFSPPLRLERKGRFVGRIFTMGEIHAPRDRRGQPPLAKRLAFHFAGPKEKEFM